MRYVLRCECGRQMVVTQAMPGLSITCGCGRVLSFTGHEERIDSDDDHDDNHDSHDEPEYEPQRGTTTIPQFARTIHQLTPRCYVTPAFFWLNIGVFVAMVATGSNLFNPTRDDLIRWGAQLGPSTLGGEYWRMLTAMFVHIGALHLACNMWALWQVGFLVEKLVGNAGFFILYIVSGLVGSLAMLFWNPNSLCAGASGAIFGVIGALYGFVYRQRETVPPRILSSLNSSLVTFVGANVAITMLVPGIGVAAHLGGLAAGLLCGVGLSQPITLEARRRRPWRNLLVAAAGAVAIGVAFLLLPRPLDDLEREIPAVSKVEQKAISTYTSAEKRRDGGDISDAELANIIEREVLPPWREITEHIAALSDVPDDQKQLHALLVEYLRGRQRSWELEAQSLREKDPAKKESLRESAREQSKLADQALKKFNNRQ